MSKIRKLSGRAALLAVLLAAGIFVWRDGERDAAAASAAS